MIQPMMYFHLENVPMFWGAYLITEVKHNIKPHYVTTTFKGTRVPRVIIPLVTDTYSTMVLSKTDPKKGTGPAIGIIEGLTKNKDGLNTVWGSQGGQSWDGTSEQIDLNFPDPVPYDKTVYGDNSTQKCPSNTRISDGGVAEAFIKGSKYKIRLCKVKDTQGGVGKVNVAMALNLANMMDRAAADGVKLTIGSNFRTNEKQREIAVSNGCYDTGTFVNKKNGGCRIATAPPGYSNHQSGTAIDFGCGGSTICYPYDSEWCSKVGSTNVPAEFTCFKWMVENANEFSYYNYPSEGWHWSATGG